MKERNFRIHKKRLAHDGVCTTITGISSAGTSENQGSIDAPAISSDAGGLLLREWDSKLNIVGQFAKCFEDHPNPVFTVHSLEKLLS